MSKTQETQSFPVKLAGVTHRNADGTKRQRIISMIRVGDDVVLVHESSNPYDGDAVAVFSAYGQIGYLPQDSAIKEVVVDRLAMGQKIIAKVLSTARASFLGPLGVVIEIYKSNDRANSDQVNVLNL